MDLAGNNKQFQKSFTGNTVCSNVLEFFRNNSSSSIINSQLPYFRDSGTFCAAKADLCHFRGREPLDPLMADRYALTQFLPLIASYKTFDSILADPFTRGYINFPSRASYFEPWDYFPESVPPDIHSCCRQTLPTCRPPCPLIAGKQVLNLQIHLSTSDLPVTAEY